MEHVERLGFRALILENVDRLSFFNMLGIPGFLFSFLEGFFFV